MNSLPILCLLTPAVTAVLVFLWPGSRRAGAWVSVVGMIVLVAFAAALLREVWSGGVISQQLGGWRAPFGITFVADAFSAMLVLVAGIVGLAVAVHAIDDIPDEQAAGGFDSFLHLLITGVVGAFLTGDIFNLYVWFEVMLISSFALMVLGGDKVRLDGAVKYVVLNLVSTVIFLTSIGLLYGLAGTLNMADLNARLPEVENQGLVTVVSVLFLIAFGIKAAVFPLFFWLPASYHTLPITVSALFAALMTKVGVYALMRIFTLVFTTDGALVQGIVLATALATMFVGVLGAMTHTDMRRILSYHIIASIGFMLLGLGIGSPLAMAASIFYMVHGILVKVLLFMLIGRIAAANPEGSFELGRSGGLYKARPGLAVLFLLAALALIGIPPLSGFWAKLALVDAGIAAEAWWVIGVMLAVSLLTFVPLIRIWSEAFWKAAPERAGGGAAPVPSAREAEAISAAAAARAPDPGRAAGKPDGEPPPPDLRDAPVIALSALLLLVGFLPAPLLSLTDRSAEGLMDPAPYIDSVLGTPEESP